MNVLVPTGQIEAHEAQVTPPVDWQPESWPEWFSNTARFARQATGSPGQSPGDINPVEFDGIKKQAAFSYAEEDDRLKRLNQIAIRQMQTLTARTAKLLEGGGA